MRWFTANPVLMGCLVPIVLWPTVFLLNVAISAATFRLSGSLGVVLFLLRLAILALPLVWALVVWAKWFARRP